MFTFLEILSAVANAPLQQDSWPGLTHRFQGLEGTDPTGYPAMENPTQERHRLTL